MTRKQTMTIIILMISVIGIMLSLYILMQKTGNVKITVHGTDATRIESKQNQSGFSDGLAKPQKKIGYKTDETGDGITNIETFMYDINNDKQDDKITRIRHENGTAHFWDEYTIELNQNGTFRTIQTDDFRTINGAECALQKLRFVFKPKFQVIKIARPWVQSWVTPSVATQTIYELKNNQIVSVSKKQLASVCDVTDLFIE